MPITHTANIYHGVNAHLHSLFQAGEESWTSFHALMISLLTVSLNANLPKGYRAQPEQSLQVHVGDEDGEMRVQTRRPDVAVWGKSGHFSPVTQQSPQDVAVATWQTTIAETLEEPYKIPSVVVYQGKRPIARLELLSASNKPGASGFSTYRQGRNETIMSGVVLVEIDLLHETPSPVPTQPRYPADDNAYPYTITMSDPRLPDDAPAVQAFGVSVDKPLPTLVLPLLAGDSVKTDYQAVYEQVFVGGAWGAVTDYEPLPLNFATYRENDQQAIRDVMARAMAVPSDEQD